MPPLPAIILGVNGHSRAVSAVRSLGRAGIPVIGVTHAEHGQDCYSRYLQRTFRVEPVADELLPFLESVGRNGGGVLFAAYDRYLILVSKHLDLLSKHFALTMPSWEILSRVMDHGQLYEIARRVGLRTPAFFKPRDEADLRHITRELDLAYCEYLLKTIPGVGAADLDSGRATKGPAPIRARSRPTAWRSSPGWANFLSSRRSSPARPTTASRSPWSSITTISLGWPTVRGG